MELNPAAFNQLIDHLGEDFMWRKSFACPCLNPQSGAPRAGCPQCGGKGRLWNAAVKARAGVASSNTQLQWAKMGQYESGDLVLSIAENSPMYEIGQFDRVVALTMTDDFSLPLVRGAPNERIHGMVLKFTRVFWLDADSDIVEGSLPEISEAGVLSWPAGAPPAGTSYSISGIRHNEFFCFGAFSNDRMKHGGARLPRKMVMRRFDLFGRNGQA